MAWATTIALVLAAMTLWLVVTDRPLLDRVATTRIETRAAFAVRDRVPAFQQWGTRSFTLPALTAAYGAVDYLTITSAAVDWRLEYTNRLEQLLRTHATVDVFLLAHSNEFDRWTMRIAPELRRKLRLVYNTGCFDLAKRDAWLALGARSYVGHVGLSESPVFYVFFLRRWLRGGTLDAVVAECNRRTRWVLECMADNRDLQFNRQATAEATHAEIAGDARLDITGGGS